MAYAFHIAIILCYILAISSPIVSPKISKLLEKIIIYAPIAFFVYFLYLLPQASQGTNVWKTIQWVPQLGLEFSLRSDPLAILFGMIVSGIGCFIFPYANSYLVDDPRKRKLLAQLIAFMASMLGLVFADNILLLYIFWELTGIFSYLLIGYHSESKQVRANALQALIVTSAGGLGLLAGLILLGQAAGTYEISKMFALQGNILSHPNCTVFLGLIIFGCATKSAQFPFHFWLPKAMVAPTPVSAYLHSATMVKAGVYLLVRFLPIFGPTSEWFYALVCMGTLTMLIGSILLLKETDTKLVLAYSTVGALGLMVMLLGLGSELALGAAVAFIIAHAIYKASGFMVAGNIQYATGIRDIRHLGNLAREMPITCWGALLVFANMIGLLFFFGFVAKESVWHAILRADAYPNYLIFITFITVVAFTIAAGLVLVFPFFKKIPEPLQLRGKLSLVMNYCPLIIALIGLILGLYAAQVGVSLIQPILQILQVQAGTFKLATWHGFTFPLLLTTLSIITGFLGLLRWRTIQASLSKILAQIPFSAEKTYEFLMRNLFRFATFQTRIIQNGYLRYYFSVFVAYSTILVAIPLIKSAGVHIPKTFIEFSIVEIILCVIALIAAVLTIISVSRLAAVAALSVVGYSVALIFLLYGAPDVSMTQVLVDTLMVIIFVLVFYHLPRFSRFSTRKSKLRDGIIAGAFGLTMMFLNMSLSDTPIHPPVSQFFSQNSVNKAQGANIVNTILIDFRGLDTLGEITVLSLAAIGVYSLLKFNRLKRKEKEQ